MSHSRRMGIALTEKEKELLRQLGKITKQEIMEAEVNDMPPRVRLACQYFVRDEDILVTFDGDETLPVKGSGLSMAAAIYKGGLRSPRSMSSSISRCRWRRMPPRITSNWPKP